MALNARPLVTMAFVLAPILVVGGMIVDAMVVQCPSDAGGLKACLARNGAPTGAVTPTPAAPKAAVSKASESPVEAAPVPPPAVAAVTPTTVPPKPAVVAPKPKPASVNTVIDATFQMLRPPDAPVTASAQPVAAADATDVEVSSYAPEQPAAATAQPVAVAGAELVVPMAADARPGSAASVPTTAKPKASSVVASVAPPQDPAPAKAGAAGSVYVTIGGGGAYVRTSPARGSVRLFALARGDRVRITQTQKGWDQIVDAKGRTGWVYAALLQNRS